MSPASANIHDKDTASVIVRISLGFHFLDRIWKDLMTHRRVAVKLSISRPQQDNDNKNSHAFSKTPGGLQSGYSIKVSWGNPISAKQYKKAFTHSPFQTLT
jgi:hypothetical protein